MEDPTVYSPQEIETIKQKLSAFRETLMALKMGTSTQEFQMIKDEFSELKRQMSQIEGLTEAMDKKQSTPGEVYEERANPFLSRLTAANQAVEEVRQEIASISNKLPIDKNKDNTQENIANIKGDTQINRFTRPINHVPASNQSPSPSAKHPSFMQLRNLANQVNPLPEVIVPVELIEEKEMEKSQRHFNEHYFQMSHTHPDSIYNGLYKNAAGKTYFHFKNTQQNPHTPVQENKSNPPFSNSSSEVEKAENSVSLEHVIEHTVSFGMIASDTKHNPPSSHSTSEMEKAEISVSPEPVSENVKTATSDVIVNDVKQNPPSSNRISEIEKAEIPVSPEPVTENEHTAPHDMIASDVKHNDSLSNSITETEKAKISSSFERLTEGTNTPDPTKSTNEDVIQANAPDSNEIEMMPMEELLTAPASEDVENKKKRGSFLFNLFRK